MDLQTGNSTCDLRVGPYSYGIAKKAEIQHLDFKDPPRLKIPRLIYEELEYFHGFFSWNGSWKVQNQIIVTVFRGDFQDFLGAQESKDNEEDEEEDDEDDDDDDDDDDVAAPPPEGMYDPSEYEDLNVGPDIKELFSDILRYTPQAIELDTRFKPFIPEFIPAVGDIDAFIKVPRPDNVQDKTGLTFLDEPAAKQSDPSVLDLQLRAISKRSSQKQALVKKVDNTEKSAKSIDKWIKDISDLHRSKPPPSVHYSKPMPDIDWLMQEWPIGKDQLNLTSWQLCTLNGLLKIKQNPNIT